MAPPRKASGLTINDEGIMNEQRNGVIRGHLQILRRIDFNRFLPASELKAPGEELQAFQARVERYGKTSDTQNKKRTYPLALALFVDAKLGEIFGKIVSFHHADILTNVEHVEGLRNEQLPLSPQLLALFQSALGAANGTFDENYFTSKQPDTSGFIGLLEPLLAACAIGCGVGYPEDLAGLDKAIEDIKTRKIVN